MRTGNRHFDGVAAKHAKRHGYTMRDIKRIHVQRDMYSYYTFGDIFKTYIPLTDFVTLYTKDNSIVSYTYQRRKYEKRCTE